MEDGQVVGGGRGSVGRQVTWRLSDVQKPPDSAGHSCSVDHFCYLVNVTHLHVPGVSIALSHSLGETAKTWRNLNVVEEFETKFLQLEVGSLMCA